MKIVYHPQFKEVYESDPAAKAGRMECIVDVLLPHYDFVTPEAASVNDILLVHTPRHVSRIQRWPELYEMALLAAGGAVLSAQLACEGEPAFGVVRPPGHHASPDGCWGFCFFNNIAISIAKLREQGKITSAIILDIDMHFGDGTDTFFSRINDVVVLNPGGNRQEFLDEISRVLERENADIIAVSAGFDRHELDWGRQLKTEDYRIIGEKVKDFSERACQGRRFGILEGGYNLDVLGENVKAFIDGMN